MSVSWLWNIAPIRAFCFSTNCIIFNSKCKEKSLTVQSKTVLITGASRGIGKEIARVFAENGYRIVLNYFRSFKEAQILETELKKSGCDALSVRANVANYTEVRTMMERAVSFFGHIDVLINNAGVSYCKLIVDTTTEEWNDIFDVNVKGTFNCCKAALPGMINRKYGKIVNVSSILGVVGGSLEVAYSSSKAAIIGFTKSLAKESGPSNINVNCVAPGVIKTNMNKNLTKNDYKILKENTALKRIGDAKDVANAVLFLASEQAKFITGQVLQIDGGLII